MSSTIPADSLFHRYNESYRRFTWEDVRVFSGKKVVPKFQNQTRPNCIFMAVITWMEASLMIAGREVKLSVEDLENKVANLMVPDEDRTLNCLRVVKEQGVCSQEDYEKQIHDCITYRVRRIRPFFALAGKDYLSAVECMGMRPLLMVFHIDGRYYPFATKYKQLPVLSYERFEEGKMEGHAGCGTGYGVEDQVPFWSFLNTVDDSGPTRGFSRVIPRNVYHLYAHEGVDIMLPSRPGKRSRTKFELDDAEPTGADVPLKKHKKEHVHLMEQDNVNPWANKRLRLLLRR
ncbi:hypothetical protein ACP4OV_006819 [Aristida adscensionis]